MNMKMSKENIKLLDELQIRLERIGIKVSQDELIHEAIKFSLGDNRKNFIKMIEMEKIKKSIHGEELLKRFLNNKVRIEGDILKEHDTIL